MCRVRGYILFVILTAISTVSVLIFHAFHLLREKIELALHSERILQLRIDATSALHALHKNAKRPAHCVNPTTEQHAILQPLSWWQAHACMLSHDQLRVYYFISFSIQDDCVVVSTNQRARYQRFLVKTVNHSEHSVTAVFTSITASAPVDECRGRMHQRQVGIQLLHVFNFM